MRPGTYAPSPTPADGYLDLGYERDQFRRETINSTNEPARVDEGCNRHRP
ncbi:hypothetical protein [Micromonospora sp. NPDC047730]